MCVWQLFKEKKPPAYGKNSKLAWHRGQKGPFNTFSKNVFFKKGFCRLELARKLTFYA